MLKTNNEVILGLNEKEWSEVLRKANNILKLIKKDNKIIQELEHDYIEKNKAKGEKITDELAKKARVQVLRNLKAEYIEHYFIMKTYELQGFEAVRRASLTNRKELNEWIEELTA